MKENNSKTIAFKQREEHHISKYKFKANEYGKIDFKVIPYPKYKKVLSIYELKPSEVACIGDQMLFDVWGANRMGLTSILVNPISLEEIAFNRIGRKLENFIMNQLTKKDLFKKGRYYE